MDIDVKECGWPAAAKVQATTNQIQGDGVVGEKGAWDPGDEEQWFRGQSGEVYCFGT